MVLPAEEGPEMPSRKTGGGLVKGCLQSVMIAAANVEAGLLRFKYTAPTWRSLRYYGVEGFRSALERSGTE